MTIRGASPPLLVRWSTAAALVIALASPPAVSADTGVLSVSRTAARPGDAIELLLFCGGCVPGLPDLPRRYPGTARMPVSLLPMKLYRSLCRNRTPAALLRHGACAPKVSSPPVRPPFVALGRAVALRGGERAARRVGLRVPNAAMRGGRDAIRQYVASTNRLRFRIPDVEPGLYLYVIYRASPGPGGFLTLSSPPSTARESGDFLRVLPAAENEHGARADRSSGASAWLLVVAGLGAVGFLALLFSLLRSRSTS